MEGQFNKLTSFAATGVLHTPKQKYSSVYRSSSGAKTSLLKMVSCLLTFCDIWCICSCNCSWGTEGFTALGEKEEEGVRERQGRSAVVLVPSGDQFLHVQWQLHGLRKLLPEVLTDIPFTYHCVCVCVGVCVCVCVCVVCVCMCVCVCACVKSGRREVHKC